MELELACGYILNRLKNDLPDYLHYHSVLHTHDVYAVAKQLAESEKLDAYEKQLLFTAACYHDSGFLECTIGHEAVSCRIAKEILPGYGYTADEIDQVCGIIMATKLPQQPKNRVEEILSDADLDYLGRGDFLPISNRLFFELSALGTVTSFKQWNEMQVAFMESHHYFTSTAQQFRQAKKEENLKAIKAKL